MELEYVQYRAKSSLGKQLRADSSQGKYKMGKAEVSWLAVTCRIRVRRAYEDLLNKSQMVVTS